MPTVQRCNQIRATLVPILREIAEMLEQPLPTPRVPTVQLSVTESVDTIPYGEQDDPVSEHIESDEELPPGPVTSH